MSNNDNRISKKRLILIFIIILILSNVFTYIVANFKLIAYKDKLVIPSNEYDNLQEDIKKLEKIDELEKIIGERYINEIDEKALAEGKLRGMVAALNDPYSLYMNSEELKTFIDSTSGSYSGIGVVIVPGKDKLITIMSVMKGTPAEEAGIKSGDKVIKIDDKEYFSEDLDLAAIAMKGEADTEVKLTIARKIENEEYETMDFTITREVVKIESVSAKVLDNDLGYILIRSFADETDADFRKELKKLMSSNIKGLILDLRDNPGGNVAVTCNIADDFLGATDIIYTQNRKGEKFFEKSDKRMTDIPLVVLINGGSASASEILAGTIMDNKRGISIGEKSFGKGIIQRVHTLSDGSGLKLTEAEYFLPSGKRINGIGITPDVIVELNNDAKTGPENLDVDNQLSKAIEELLKLVNTETND